jgi:hypothetical protein
MALAGRTGYSAVKHRVNLISSISPNPVPQQNQVLADSKFNWPSQSGNLNHEMSSVGISVLTSRMDILMHPTPFQVD